MRGAHARGQRRINAVTVDLSEQALARADRADAAVTRGEALPPLHGVPITIKENVDQVGSATANGVVAYRDAIARDDHPSSRTSRRPARS